MLNQIQQASFHATAPVSSLFQPVQRPAQQPAISRLSELRPQDQVQALHAKGQIPASLNLFVAAASELQQVLAQLKASPTQATVREAQAGFRVAIRKLDLSALAALQQSLQREIQTNGDFRSQRLLDQLRTDVNMEIFSKGGKPDLAQPGMPPLPGKTPEAIVSGTLKQLHSHLSEANFKTAQAGFRVAIRALSPAQLLQTRDLVQAAIQTSGDYRSQLLLHGLLTDIASEQIVRGLKPQQPALSMPTAVGTQPAEIAVHGLKLLHSHASEANFKTAVAAVRVASRQLDAAGIAALKAELQSAMALTSDYRTQLYLDTLAREMF
ncbi:MAG: hypothetical protein IGS03_05715 [Candidatus Sericytochromatia bacterium]|nr:hypothetical protein [Candidatus Sericytochromatia bacterium]